MIKSLGFKRVFGLSVFAGIFIVVAGAYYMVFSPQASKTSATLGQLSSERSTLQTEVEKMRADYAFFMEQKPVFEKMNKLGFFAGQDRVLARQRFDSIQKMSKIISARYEIKAAALMREATVADPVTGMDVPPGPFAVMESPISVSLAALDDLDVYRFVYFLNYGFPGHMTINNLNIERKTKLSTDILKQIGQGSPPELITATMDLSWRTMSRRDSISSSGEPQPIDFNAPPVDEVSVEPAKEATPSAAVAP